FRTQRRRPPAGGYLRRFLPARFCRSSGLSPRPADGPGAWKAFAVRVAGSAIIKPPVKKRNRRSLSTDTMFFLHVSSSTHGRALAGLRRWMPNHLSNRLNLERGSADGFAETDHDEDGKAPQH